MIEEHVYEREEEIPPHVTEFIRRLMALVLDGTDPELPAIRAQYERARLGHLWWTGAGFYAAFDVPLDAPTFPIRMDNPIASAIIDLKDRKDGAEALLFAADGRLSYLTAKEFDGNWPIELEVVGIRDVSPFALQPLRTLSQKRKRLKWRPVLTPTGRPAQLTMMERLGMTAIVLTVVLFGLRLLNGC